MNEIERILNKAVSEKSRKKIAAPAKLSESRITQACVKWFRYQYPQYAQVLIHPANEGARRTKVVRTAYGIRTVCTGGSRLIAEGLVPGVADLLLLVPRKGYGCLAIEMKTESKSSRQSSSQKGWEEAANDAGNLYRVCRSLDQFIEIVSAYLG